ncbi:MAG TPA: hypothetical protein VLR69_01510 [Thermoanaerobaculia bacterium]|jgi:hypothetical protein|nr:hypothetical protein [Thermoanaerobaculia bacterium]
MAALFLVALALLAWQAPRTPPLRPDPFVSVLKPGEQVFPVAVPPEAPPRIPRDSGKRRAFLAEHTVDGFAAVPADACEGFVRVSSQHWLRVPIPPASLPTPGREGSYRLADPRGLDRLADGDPSAALLAAGPGPEVEVFCRR